jgi:hypothetical protein
MSEFLDVVETLRHFDKTDPFGVGWGFFPLVKFCEALEHGPDEDGLFVGRETRATRGPRLGGICWPFDPSSDRNVTEWCDIFPVKAVATKGADAPNNQPLPGTTSLGANAAGNSGFGIPTSQDGTIAGALGQTFKPAFKRGGAAGWVIGGDKLGANNAGGPFGEKFAGDMPGSVLAGTALQSEERCFIPSGHHLVTPHFGGPAETGTFVWDISPEGNLNPDRKTKLHSALRVTVPVKPIGDPAVPMLAFQLGTGRGGYVGGVFADDSEGHGGAAVGEGAETQDMGAASHRFGGPFLMNAGGGGCQHTFGAGPTGDGFYSLHLSTNTLFARDEDFDCPIKFDEVDWQKNNDLPGQWCEVFLRRDVQSIHPWTLGSRIGLWRMQVQIPLVPIEDDGGDDGGGGDGGYNPGDPGTGGGNIGGGWGPGGGSGGGGIGGGPLIPTNPVPWSPTPPARGGGGVIGGGGSPPGGDPPAPGGPRPMGPDPWPPGGGPGAGGSGNGSGDGGIPGTYVPPPGGWSNPGPPGYGRIPWAPESPGLPVTGLFPGGGDGSGSTTPTPGASPALPGDQPDDGRTPTFSGLHPTPGADGYKPQNGGVTQFEPPPNKPTGRRIFGPFPLYPTTAAMTTGASLLAPVAGEANAANGGTKLFHVGMPNELAVPALLLRSQSYNAGVRDFRNSRQWTGANAQALARVAPVVLRLEALGAEQGASFNYTTGPFTKSRYTGGTANAVVSVLPPELGTEAILAGNEPSTVSTTQLNFYRSALTLGTPSRTGATNGIKHSRSEVANANGSYTYKVDQLNAAGAVTSQGTLLSMGTDAAGLNQTGTNTVIQPSRGTGTGSGGEFQVAIGVAGSSGSTVHGATTRFRVTNNGIRFQNSDLSTMFQLDNSAGPAAIAFFGGSPAPQQSTFAALTNSTGGTPSTTYAAAGSTYSQTIENNFRASVVTHLSAIRAALVAYGLST